MGEVAVRGIERSLSLAEARALALRAQGFGDAALVSPLDVLERLGVIQLDSVNVLARTHEVVPFSRIGPYPPAAMREAVYAQRRGFEYWGHAASWLPMAEYRYFLPCMARRRLQPRNWSPWAQLAEHPDLPAEIMARVRTNGPLTASAFPDPRGRRGTWWDWKPAKLVLEDLFDRGELMCTDRTPGFERLYDLPERVLPAHVATDDPGALAAARYLLRRGIRALGVATATDAVDYFRLRRDNLRAALADLLASGEVVQVAVEGWQAPGYASPQALAGPLTVPEHPPTFLSPFDNLIWERSRTERLFGFTYRIEIYVPEAKRRYGYYVLPLLVRGCLVGRADLKLDRRTGNVLRVRALYMEGAEPADAADALWRLATHLAARDIAVERVEPARLLKAVQRVVSVRRPRAGH